jgi:hypothetical protein
MIFIIHLDGRIRDCNEEDVAWHVGVSLMVVAQAALALALFLIVLSSPNI